MKKILSLFQRNYDGDRLVRNEITPGTDWVVAGEGWPSEKFDGTAVRIADGKMWKRYDAKHGKPPPDMFVPAQDPDPITRHWPGWLPVGDGPEDRWHREAKYAAPGARVPDAEITLAYLLQSPIERTFELVGPKVQGNPYQLDAHLLWRHGAPTDAILTSKVSRDFDGLRRFFDACPIEGIVWHHEDGRMVKIKRKDFGLAWPPKPHVAEARL